MIDLLKVSIIVYGFFVCTEEGMIFDWYMDLIMRLPNWLYKPLGGCVKCLAGQVLFWYYLFSNMQDYSFIDQLFYPAAGIMLVTIYDYIYEKLRF